MRTHISLFHTNGEGETSEIKFPFDKIDSVKVNATLQVCVSDTIRGRNKTDHAYMNQRRISISGEFSERAVVSATGDFFTWGVNKLQNIQELFLSFIKDTRLFYIYTRYKTYKNYTLVSCSFSRSTAVGTISVSLVFVEVMFRNNAALHSDTMVREFSPPIYHSPPLSEAVYVEGSEEASGDKSLVEEFNNIQHPVR